VVWREQVSRGWTFPNKKRINIGLFIDRTAALYKVDGRIKDENLVRVINQWYCLIRGMSIPCAKSAKRCGNERQGGSSVQMEFNKNVYTIHVNMGKYFARLAKSNFVPIGMIFWQNCFQVHNYQSCLDLMNPMKLKRFRVDFAWRTGHIFLSILRSKVLGLKPNL